jgi:hypothetical protein
MKDSPETTSPDRGASNGEANHLANGVRKEPLVTWVHKNFQVLQLLKCKNCIPSDPYYLSLVWMYLNTKIYPDTSILATTNMDWKGVCIFYQGVRV